MIIILGGKSSDDITVPAEAIRKSGVSKIIVIGIGPLVSPDDLKTTASSPECALPIGDYGQLPNKIPDVIALINGGNLTR